MSKTILFIALTLLAAAGAHAQDGAADVHDRVRLSATAEREVANDLLVAVLYVEQEGPRQSEVASRVNETMAWALGVAGTVAGVDVQTLRYSTWPLYGKDSTTVTGWRARQSLRLEGRDPKGVGELVAKLQARLAVESVGYAVSREAHRAAEDSLIVEALAQFTARAGLVAASLGRPGYRLVAIDVGTAGQPDAPMPLRAAMMAEAAASVPAQLAPGEQTIAVTVSGTVQLEAPR